VIDHFPRAEAKLPLRVSEKRDMSVSSLARLSRPHELTLKASQPHKEPQNGR
jgi:hypothetical protein